MLPSRTVVIKYSGFLIYIFLPPFGLISLCFIGLFLNAKYGCKYRLDKYVMAVCVILIFLSMSKGAIMLFFFFLFAFSLDKVRKIKREQRNKILFIIAVVVMISSVFFYVNYAMNIDTYIIG